MPSFSGVKSGFKEIKPFLINMFKNLSSISSKAKQITSKSNKIDNNFASDNLIEHILL